MPRRELRVIATEKPVGTVEYYDGKLRMTGSAGDVFAGLLKRLGERRLGEELIGSGWSNGWLYLAPAKDDSRT